MLVETNSARKCEPMYIPGAKPPLSLDFKIPASKSIVRGQVCGELAATLGSVDAYAAYDLSTDTPTIAPVPTEGAAGTLDAGDYYVGYTEVTANGESLMVTPVAVTIGASKQIAVATIALRTGVTSLRWYMSIAANSTIMRFIAGNNGVGFNINALPAANAAYPPSVATSFRTATGLHVPKMIAQYDYTTDGDGNIFIGTTAASSHGEYYKAVPFWMEGYFRTEDLTGFTAAVLNHPGWRLAHGSVSAGLLHLM